ncbi:MAG: hypothetical protein ACI9SQ_000765 [Rubritalea sp.]|jgi:hypothetical protein
MSDNAQNDLQEPYWKHLLLKGKRPKSVYALMDSLQREEAEFYENYASLDALESAYWQSTVDETINVLEHDEDYAEYPADQKLLAFYFTYITHIQKNRSRFVGHFPKLPNPDQHCSIHDIKLSMSMPHSLKGMSRSFKHYAKSIVKEGVQGGIFADRKKLTDQYDRLLLVHFLAVINYYIKDNSESFQDTDAFIEKSTNFAIQAAADGVLEAGFDFVRFIVGKDDRLKGMSKMMSKFIPE